MSVPTASPTALLARILREGVPAAQPLIASKARYALTDSPRRSGKSDSLCRKLLSVMLTRANMKCAFVSDTLKPDVKDTGALAAFLHDTTSGNPFFMRLFLGFMHEFGLLWFDAGLNRWEWQTEKVGDTRLPGTVVELFSRKLGQLDADARGLFAFAACLGNRFDLDTLGIISGRTPGDCLALLSSDQAQSMLLRLGGDGADFAFLHDQAQKAAYSLIDPAGLPAIRLKIGRLLLLGLGPERLAERLFEVVGDLNAVIPMLIKAYRSK